MIFEGIGRIIGCSNKLYIALQHELARGHTGLFDVRIGAVEDLVCIFRGESILDTEVHGELHVGPNVQRVAGCGLDACGISAELFTRRCIAGDILFRYTAGAHQTPLVVVTAEPDLCDVGKNGILKDLFRLQVAVVVNNGQCTYGIIQTLCGAAF